MVYLFSVSSGIVPTVGLVQGQSLTKFDKCSSSCLLNKLPMVGTLTIHVSTKNHYVLGLPGSTVQPKHCISHVMYLLYQSTALGQG